MKAPLLARFLFGDRRAILMIARSKWAVVAGALFVLAAGVAREYDGEDLVHEPWHALRPFAASLVSGSVLFLLVHGITLARRAPGSGTPPRFGAAYTSFLGLYWMTAPLAWLYAIPYERFMSPLDAIVANLWTLAIVAIWRVALTTRIVCVVYGVGPLASFFLVMLFANAVTIAALAIAPTPVIDVMGGLRQSERDQLVGSITFLATVLAWLSAPVWVVCAAVAAVRLRPKWPESDPDQEEKLIPRSLFVPVCVALIVSAPLLAIGQPEQMRRRRAEELFSQSRFDAGLAFLSERHPSDFPPFWEPPPDALRWQSSEMLDGIRGSMLNNWPKSWVADIYLAKFKENLVTRIYGHGGLAEAVRYLEGGMRQEVDLAVPAQVAAFLLEHDNNLSAAERLALERLIQIASDPNAAPNGLAP